MADELQPLLEKIQSEGVAKAKARADEIVAKAKADAAAIVAAAREEAAQLRADAEAEAERFRARGEESLRQAARNVRLQVAGDLQGAFERALLRDVSDALSDPAELARLAEEVVRAEAAAGDGASAELHVAPERAEALARHLQARLAGEAAGEGGLSVAPDDGVRGGIRVFLRDGRVEHDFTDEAVAAALARAVRPALARLVEAP